MKTYINLVSLLLVTGLTTHQPSFVPPLQSDQMIVSKFGNKYHPILQKERFHEGVDYKVPVGTKVFASAEGTVRFVGQRGSYGNLIVIEHESGFETYYCHLSRPDENLSAGRDVESAQLIGYTGESGKVMAPHLHFEIRKNGKPVDPEKYLAIE